MKLPAGLLALNEKIRRTSPAYMVLVALVVGILAGHGAVGFRLLIRALQNLLWDGDGFSIARVEELPWYHVLAVPTLAGLVVGLLVWVFAREAKGHGVPEVMEAVALRNGFIRARVVVVKALASGLCIASGGSVGREGPIVQIGSALGSTIGQALEVGSRRLRTLVGCGAAAGIAATFNAPVAGALFAVEVILGDFAVPQFSPIVISSVAATVVSRHYFGDVAAFEIPPYDLGHPLELGAYVILGVLAALLAVGFARSLYFAEDWFDRLRVFDPLKTAFGGACIGGMALLGFPHVMGVGYETIEQALGQAPTAWQLLAMLLLAKVAAVSITLGSGGSGGVFAPSLFMGAMLGALVGTAVNTWFPGQTAPPGAYALVGMAAVVAGATHAPITAIVILFELTNDYEIILPLMTSSILATLVAMRLNKESIYTLKLARRGVDIRAGQDINLLRHVRVREILRDGAPTVTPNTRLDEMLQRFSSSDASNFYVVDRDGRLFGVISFSELRRVLDDPQAVKGLFVAEDIANPRFPKVAADDTLDHVIQQLDLGYRDELPVVESDRLVGTVHMEDVLGRYRIEVLKRQAAAEV